MGRKFETFGKVYICTVLVKFVVNPQILKPINVKQRKENHGLCRFLKTTAMHSCQLQCLSDVAFCLISSWSIRNTQQFLQSVGAKPKEHDEKHHDLNLSLTHLPMKTFPTKGPTQFCSVPSLGCTLEPASFSPP